MTALGWWRSPAGLGLAAILGAAAGLRLWGLGQTGLWLDEGISVWFASQPLDQFFAYLRFEANPALFYLLLKAWLSLGQGDLWVRLLPALLGTASVGLVYILGRRLFASKGAGLIAALLIALSPFHLHYSQEVRPYILWFGLTALALLMLLRWVETRRLLFLAGYAGATALSFYTHYSAAFYLPAALLAALLWTKPLRPELGRLAAGHLLLLGLILPGLAFFWVISSRVSQDYWVQAPTYQSVKLALDHLVAPLAGWGEHTWPLLAVLAALSLPGRRSWGLIGLIAIPVGTMLALSLTIKPILIPRVILPSLLPAALLAAGLWPAKARWRRRLGRIAVGLYLALCLIGLAAYYTHPGEGGRDWEEWREATGFILAQKKPGDWVVFVPAWNESPFAWYEEQAGGEPMPKWGFPRRLGPDWPRFHSQPHDLPQALPQFWSGLPQRGRIWLVVSHFHDPEGALLTSFEARGQRLGEWPFRRVEVYLFGLEGKP